MKEITVFDPRPKKTWYTFEFQEKSYLMTKSDWVDGKMMIHGLCEDGSTICMEMQYGVSFTGSRDSIDSWFSINNREVIE